MIEICKIDVCKLEKLQHEMLSLCGKYDENIQLTALMGLWETCFCNLFSDKIEVEKILDEHLLFLKKNCLENVYNTGDFTLGYQRLNEFLQKIEILKNVIPEDEIGDQKYPEYPYESNYVPPEYILISDGIKEARWVHPSTIQRLNLH